MRRENPDLSRSCFEIARPVMTVYTFTVTLAAQELIGIVAGLPEDKAREVVDFARFLQQQAGDMEWERILDAQHAYPRLEHFAAASLREGEAEQLDISKL